MKQLFLERGNVQTYNVSEPLYGPNDILVNVHYSFISSGTESATVATSQIGLAKKFYSQLQTNTQKLIDTFKQHGYAGTRFLLKEKAHQKLALGYSCSGQIVAKGKNITHVQPGDYVACAGAGLANHAQIVAVPDKLVTRLSDATHLREASITTLGAIALQGIRRADLHLGEQVCVIGLGILGQLTVSLARSSGCTVFGIDIRQERLERAKKMGAHKTFNGLETDVVKAMHYATMGFGADVTIITAAAATGDIIQQAMHITRRKGKIVLVGDVKIDIPRDPFYTKEIDFLISCSYGPGRYDTSYEKDNIDYPYAYVRWTEQRNMACFVQMIENKTIDISPLIDHEFSIENASQAYDVLKDQKNIGVVLKYASFSLNASSNCRTGEGRYPEFLKSEDKDKSLDPVFQRDDKRKTLLLEKKLEKITVACIGAGGFAKTKLLPMITQHKDVILHTIVDTDATTTLNLGSIYKAQITNDYTTLLTNHDIDAVIIATPHFLHTQQTIDSLTAGKAVFVEKPAAVSFDQLDQLTTFLSAKPHPTFCVDFNRPFSPFMQKIELALAQRAGPLLISYRMNVGYLDSAHWIQSKANGGRIIGEACHIIDLFLFLTQSTPQSITVQSIPPRSSHFVATDNVMTTLRMTDGSLCCLVYTAQGDPTAGKESMEIHFDGKTIIMNDFVTLIGHGLSKAFSAKVRTPDKGHQELINRFFDGVKNGTPGPVPIERILGATQISLTIDNTVR